MPVCRRSFWIAAQPTLAPGWNSIASSPICTRPEVGISRRLMQRSSVDLPPPDGPTSAVTLPSAKVTLTSFSTVLSPNRFSICWSSITRAPP